MTFLISHSGTFVADHFHDLPGFVEARHGHNWQVSAEVTQRDDSTAPRLEACLMAWIQTLDYTLLNEQPRLQGVNPTAEALAHWLFEDLENAGLEPSQVKVREKAHYWAACLPGARA